MKKQLLIVNLLFLVILTLNIYSFCYSSDGEQDTTGSIELISDIKQLNIFSEIWSFDPSSKKGLQQSSIGNGIHGRGIYYDERLYIEVGENGKIKTSQNGVNWENQKSGTDNTITALIKGNNQYVAVGYDGTILTSADGYKWSVEKSDTNETLYNVLWLNNKYFAVGTNGTILVSTDAKHWIKNNINIDSSVYSLVWSGNRYIAVGGEPSFFNPEVGETPPKRIVYSSDDSVSWSKCVSSSEQVLYDVIWAKDKFYAVGGLGVSGEVSGIFSSLDGKNWVELNSDVLRGNLDGYELNSLVYTDGTFIVAGSGILCSKDGLNWNVVDKNLGYVKVLRSKNYFYALNQDGRIVLSSDGQKWDKLCLSGVEITDMVSNGKQYLAVGDGIYFSKDQKMWVECSQPYSKDRLFSRKINSIIWANKKYISVGDNGLILSSSNGVDWNDEISNTNSDLTDVTYGKGRYVAVGRSGEICVSKDAKTWSQIKYPSSESDVINKNIYCITWAENQFIATGDIYSFLTSSDGINWRANNFDALFAANSISWGAKKYIAAGCYDNYMSSINGHDWKYSKFLFDKNNVNIEDLVWGNKEFAAVGYYVKNNVQHAVLYTSPDGIKWTCRIDNINGIFNKVLWDGKKYTFIKYVQ